ncbi:hypothetical protein [Alicyclobacillus fodiniaquatilis]|uniref:Sporulation protein YjcZ n=1 Tax=Alicyclobacillus fodiniaquatilis TaxID=1661150 RepID=A0ABW4JH00_9BACL
MDGLLGGYTRWAIVFLIIFVLFFLLVPAVGYGAATSCSCAGGVGY